jgi:hypothetical protein
VGNLKGRVERLEGGWKERGIPIIIVMQGESTEEAWQRHLAQHPKDEKAEVSIIIKRSGQDAPSAPPPPRPEPKYGAQAPGPGPLQITR